MKRLVATVSRHENCPLYRVGDALEFVPPTVTARVPICAKAVASLNGSASGEVFCGGCTGQAWFRLTSEHFESSTVRAEDLAKLGLFAGIPPERLAPVLSLFREEEARAGEEIPARNGLHFIRDGECEVVADEKRLWLLRAGECFGVVSLMTGEPAGSIVRARTKTRLWVVARADFPRLAAAVPGLVLALAQVLAQRLARASRWVVERGLVGKFEIIRPVELVQAMHVNGMTGMLVAEKGPTTVCVTFHEGQVTDVESAELDGEAAFYDFLDWRRGSFRFEPVRARRAGRIDKSTFTMLLEGMRRSDETKVRRAETPDPDSAPR